jgi:hypothetical protein
MEAFKAQMSRSSILIHGKSGPLARARSLFLLPEFDQDEREHVHSDPKRSVAKKNSWPLKQASQSRLLRL